MKYCNQNSIFKEILLKTFLEYNEKYQSITDSVSQQIEK